MLCKLYIFFISMNILHTHVCWLPYVILAFVIFYEVIKLLVTFVIYKRIIFFLGLIKYKLTALQIAIAPLIFEVDAEDLGVGLMK